MKKLFVTLTVMTVFIASMNMIAFASSASSQDSRDAGNSEQQSTSVVLPTADDYNIVTNDDLTVTFKRADGSIMANVNVTVKNTTTGQEGDISRDEFATDENGVFDYSQWTDNGVAILRLTDSVLGGTLEYTIETGAINIEAGKGSGGGGGGGGGDAAASSVTMYIIIAVVVVVIGIVAVIVVVKQKQAKKKFAEKSKSKSKKK